MEKENKENFIELPLHAFKKKSYPVPPFLLQSKLQRTPKNLAELKKIIESQDYSCIALLSEERNVFCVKLASNDKLAIVQIKEASCKNKCIYVSLNLTPSLKKDIRNYFTTKNWKINNKIYLEDDRNSGLALLEYNFAQNDLRNYITKHMEMGKTIASFDILHIAKDTIDNLCFHHLQETLIIDIRPETIFYQEGKWFILNGDHSQRLVNDFGSTLNKPVNVKLNDKRYLAPNVIQYQQKNDINITHNPFKSDVYSLGLVLLEIVATSILDSNKFKEILETRKGLKEEIQKFDLPFRQKMIIANDRCLQIPNLLRDMLNQKQEQRPFIFEVCLTARLNNSLFHKLYPPYQYFFHRDIIDLPNQTRKKVTYSHCLHSYEGQIDLQAWNDKQELIREGRGIMYYNNIKICEGEWKKNLPHNKCSLQLSNLLNYEGQLVDGQFHGPGFLSFNGSKIGDSKWYEGLNQQKCLALFREQIPQSGYYLFLHHPLRNQHLVYNYKLHNAEPRYILNLIQLQQPKLILYALSKFLKYYEIEGIQILWNVANWQYHSSNFEMIRANIKNKQNETCYIDIMTSPNKSVSFLVKLLKQKIMKEPSRFTCVNNHQITQQQIRDLIDAMPNLTYINISNCQRLTDNIIKHLPLSLTHLMLSHLSLTDKSLQYLICSKQISQISSLSLNHCYKITSDKLSELLIQPRLTSLQELSCEALSINHHAFDKITNQRHFQLTSLNLGLCHKINDLSLNDFLTSEGISSLKSLAVFSTSLKDSILETLSSARTEIDSLKELNLSGCINLTCFSLTKFLLSQNVLELTTLNLSGTDINDQFLSVLSRKSTLSATLKHLSLSCCFSLGDKGLKQLLKPQKLTKLLSLDLSKNNISNDTLFVLSEVTVRQLRILNLSKCSKMNDTGFQKFLNSENIKMMHSLDISGTGIKSTIFNILTSSKHTGKLTHLNLSECKCIQQNSLLIYTHSERFTLLKSLCLNNTTVSDRFIESIQQNPYARHHFLNLSVQQCRNITENGKKMLNIISRLNPGILNRQPFIKNDPEQLSKNPILIKMTELQITKQEIPKLEHLFSSDYINNLSKIALTWMNINNCLDSLNNNHNFHHFKRLNITGSKFNQDKFINLLSSPSVKNLETLDISWTDCSNSVLFALADSNHLINLRSLKTAKCIQLNDKGFQRLFNSSKASLLSVLDLRATLITNTTLEAMQASKYLKNVTILNLRACPNIKDLGLKQYLRSANCTLLKDIDLGWTKINGQIFSHLANAKKLNQLTHLRLPGTKGIQHQLCKFLESPPAASLTLIDLNYSEISSKIVNSLANSKYLTSLEELEIKGFSINQTTINSLITLIKSGSLNKLKSMKLLIDRCRDTDLQKLKNEFGQYLGKIQQLCLVGLAQGQLQKWKKFIPKCQIINKDAQTSDT